MRNALLVLSFIVSSSIWAQFQVSTYPTITENDGDVGILFELSSNSYITITGISNTFNQEPVHVSIWIREGGIRGNVPFIDTANGWVEIGDSWVLGNHVSPVLIPLLLNYEIEPNKLYAVFLECDTGGTRYRDHQPSDPITYTDNIVTLFVGPSGYGGCARTCFPSPPSPVFHGKDIIGGITYKFTPTLNDAGITNILVPNSGCDGSIQDVKVELSNLGINQINNLKINWTVNGLLQPSFTYNNLLDTANGSGKNIDTITLGVLPLVGGMNYEIIAWTENPNGNIDAFNNNDSSSIILHAYNIPLVNIGRDTTTCMNNPITLDAGKGYDSLRWDRGTTDQLLVADTARTYMVDVWKNGCRGSDTIGVSFFPTLPILNLGNDTTICFGGSILLDATATGVTYLWHDSTTSSTYVADTIGNYSVTIEDTNTCKNTDDINVSFLSAPHISLSVAPGNTLCYGFPFEFTAAASTQGPNMYQWKINGVNSGGPTTDSVFSPSLQYGDSVNVDLITDVCSTSTYSIESNFITMYINPEPKLINGKAETDTVYQNTSKNYSVPFSQGSVFSWWAFGGDIKDPIGNSVLVKWGKSNSKASIMVNEKDSSNCFYTSSRDVVIISMVGVKNEDNQLGIGYAYPNPSNTLVTIPLISDGSWSIDLSLYTVTGKKVKTIYNGEVYGNKDFTFSVNELESGIYFYQVSTSDGYKSVKKLVVRH